MDMDGSYEDGGLYIILTRITGRPKAYHWGLFLCVSSTYGMVYHATDTRGTWEMEYHMSENVVESRNIVAALQIGQGLQDPRDQELDSIVRDVPVSPEGGLDQRWGEDFTRRIWILEAVDRLRMAGLIPDVQALDLSVEAESLGYQRTSTGTRRLRASRALRRQRR